MNDYTVQSAAGLRGVITVPGDKSISHRSIMFGALANGTTVIRGFLRGEDTISTLRAFRDMGVDACDDGDTVRIRGAGLHGLKEPEDVLDCGNSGTSMRLLAGLLAGQDFFSVLTGDRYLRNRPMGRVIKPLAGMGATLFGREGGSRAPLAVQGRKLKGIRFDSPVASAQVKSAILLAGLYADGETSVTEPFLSRDHSERMLSYFGADIEPLPNGARIRGGKGLKGQEVLVPGDISSAAFFIVAALLVPDSELLIESVGMNPTRTGVIDILLQMGASIEQLNPRVVSGEPIADLLVRSSSLQGIDIGGELVPRAIDEFPIIFVAAAHAEGKTVLRDARELRVKETDRIAAMARNLSGAGADVVETEDGMEITGGGRLSGGAYDSFGDHRIAMSMLIAGLVSRGTTTVNNVGCVSTSFPSFFNLLERVRG